MWGPLFLTLSGVHWIKEFLYVKDQKQKAKHVR